MQHNRILFIITAFAAVLTASASITHDDNGSVTTVVGQSVQPVRGLYKNSTFQLRQVKSANGVVNRVAAETSQTYTPPFAFDFRDTVRLADFSVYDANGDKNTWSLTSDNQLVYPAGSSNANDWLFSPQFALKSSGKYRLRATFHTYSASYPERIGVSWGTSTTTSSLQTLVAEKTFAGTYSIDTLITPSADGGYYFGFHAVSSTDGAYLFFDEFSISAPLTDESPASVSDLSIQPFAQGILSANLSFTSPSTTIKGEAISKLSKIVVRDESNGRIVTTITDTIPGSRIKFTDNKPQNGINTYSITCYGPTADAQGDLSTGQAWIGLDVPQAPTNVRWSYDGSSVKVTWGPSPSAGLHGGYVDSTKVIYDIYNSIYQNYDAINWTSFTFTTNNIITSSRQQPLYYLIVAKNDAGTGSFGESNHAPYGKAYEVPFREDFAKGDLSSNPWINLSTDQSRWGAVVSTDGVEPCSDDGGMLVNLPGQRAGFSLCYSPLIDLTTVDNPAFSVAVSNESSQIDVLISNNSGLSWQSVGTLPKTAKGAWQHKSLDLTPFKNYSKAIIALRVQRTTTGGNPACFDDYIVAENTSKDLAVTSLNVDKKIVAGDSLNVSVGITNNGIDNSGRYTVKFLNGDNELDSVTRDGIAAATTDEFTFKLPTSVDQESFRLTAKVQLDGDTNATNDTLSADVVTTIPNYPAPTNLNGNAKGRNVSLTWTAPDNSPVKPADESFSDDMEGYEAWTIGGIDEQIDYNGKLTITSDSGKIGSYKLLDRDHESTQYSYVASEYPHRGARMAVQVFNDQNPDNWTTQYNAHSGHQMLCFWNIGRSGKSNDDWLILPQLGADKHLSFYARPMNRYYKKEKLRIEISTTDDKPDSFKLFKELSDIPYGQPTAAEGGYTLYSYELPADARFVAFHYVTPAMDGMGLLIDDIKATLDGGSPVTYDLLGYNVYRNGKRVNASTVADTKYTDVVNVSGPAAYKVTAVYAQGESVYSNEWQTTVDGITTIHQDSRHDGQWYNLQGQRVSRPTSGIYIKNGKKYIVK